MVTERGFKILASSFRDGYGERCPDFDPECITCLVWRAFDALCDAEADITIEGVKALQAKADKVMECGTWEQIPPSLQEVRWLYAAYQDARARFLQNRSSSLPVDRHSPSAASAVEGAFSEDER